MAAAVGRERTIRGGTSSKGRVPLPPRRCAAVRQPDRSDKLRAMLIADAARRARGATAANFDRAPGRSPACARQARNGYCGRRPPNPIASSRAFVIGNNFL